MKLIALITRFTIFIACLLCTISKEQSRSDLVKELFGETLYRWEADATEKQIIEEPTETLLANKKVIGVYFSASWCGPCQQFTPLLAQFYNDMKKKGKPFEVVWVSRDRGPNEFLDYYSKMPWLAVTWENFQSIGQKTAALYGMKGIPHLAILDGDDLSVITTDGRTLVMKDKYGLEFPWRPRSLLGLIPKPIKKYIQGRMRVFMRSMTNTLRGLSDGVAPAKILHILKTHTARLLSHAYHSLKDISSNMMGQVIQLIRAQLEKNGLVAASAPDSISGSMAVVADTIAVDDVVLDREIEL